MTESNAGYKGFDKTTMSLGIYDICSLDHEALIDLIKSKFQPFIKLQFVIST